MISARHCCLIAIGLLSILQPSITASAEDAGKPAAKPKKSLPPEARAVLTRFLDQVKDVKKTVWKRKIRDEIDRIIKVSGPLEGRTKLEAAGDAAIEACLPGWATKLEEMYEGFMANQSSEELAMSMEHMQAAEGSEIAATENDWVSGFVRPIEHEIWTTALTQNLPTEQAAVWKAAEENRKDVALKEIREFLKPMREQNREIHRKTIAPRKTEIQTAAKMSPERAKTLDELANAAMDASMERWQKGAEETLLAMDDAQRKATMKGRNFYTPTADEDLPYMMPAWKEGLANFLTEEERHRCEKMNAEKAARRKTTFARMLIALLDQKIAFRPLQREALQPIADRLIEGHPALESQRSPYNYYETSAHTFLRTAAKASAEEIAQILDPAQCKRWKETVAASETAVVAHRVHPDPDVAAGVEPTPPEPEELERVISDFLQKKFSKPKHGRSRILVEMEDIERVVAIAPTTAARLRTAALGASEQALLVWQGQVEENVRSQVRDATAANLAQRLEGMQDYQFSQRQEDSTTRAIWDAALKTELTDEQRTIWRKEADDRIAFETRVIAEVIVAEFDRAHSLRIEQSEKLESAITALLAEYREDMTRFSSSYNDTPWYLQPYQCFMPVCGIPEKEMKEILTQEQWDGWTGSEQYANSTGNWENIKSNREQRLKDKKTP